MLLLPVFVFVARGVLLGHLHALPSPEQTTSFVKSGQMDYFEIPVFLPRMVAATSFIAVRPWSPDSPE